MVKKVGQGGVNGFAAGPREAHLDTSTVSRVRAAADQAALFEAIHSVRHRS